MADPYQKVKGGRLTFKGGSVASLSKSIDKKKKKKNKKNKNKETHTSPQLDEAFEFPPEEEEEEASAGGGEDSTATDKTTVAGVGGDIYTIDAAKRRKYDELFPVEAKKFGYDPKSQVKSVEDALDDRVKKKADRYCK